MHFVYFIKFFLNILGLLVKKRVLKNYSYSQMIPAEAVMKEFHLPEDLTITR